MRLLHYDNNGILSLTEFSANDRPNYAILSHRWDTEEFTFDDLRDGIGWGKAGYKKIRNCGVQAKRDGLEYFWVDTCCIDKSSSAELSEAINSMFEWYKQSTFCYAYLSDVGVVYFDETFRASRWFKRGWTLQELIAPETVRFFDVNWTELGSRTDLCEVIASITSISENVLQSPDALPYHSIAQRMSWAAGRETTRPEDTAYSLLGIFGIHMPLLYGEQTRAFTRLQEEIIRNSTDDSILAWGLDTQPLDRLAISEIGFSMTYKRTSLSLLARSPQDFKNCGMVQSNVQPSSAYTITNFGLEIKLPCASSYSWDDVLQTGGGGLSESMGGIGLLRCTGSNGAEIFGIRLSSLEDGGRCDRIESGPSKHSTVLVDARIASRATMQHITINHGRDWEIKQGRLRSLKQLQHIIINSKLSFCLPLQIVEVNSYRLKSPWKKNDHTWDPESQVIRAWVDPPAHIESEEHIFVIEYQGCSSQITLFEITAATFFVVFWRGEALIRKMPPFFSSDYDKLEMRYPNERRWRTNIAFENLMFSSKKFETMAESVTFTHRKDKTKLELGVDVRKNKLWDTCFFTLELSVKKLVPRTHDADAMISSEQSYMVD